ncbi:MAG: NUDIX domain-containing protein [Phototrophicaceae bacterium]
MSFLRVGTAVAVLNGDGQILLSHRGDMDVWNLPTGRLDAHEALSSGAVREVKEETGLHVALEYPIGLYYFEATSRLNVLFVGFPIAGTLQAQTDETRDNRYFTPSELPNNLFATYMAQDAVHQVKARTLSIATPPAEMRRIRRRLAQRWVMNWLRGRPEPRHVPFHVTATALIWDHDHNRLLVDGENLTLPHVLCRGQRAPWLDLQHKLESHYHIQGASLRWVGIWQDPLQNQIDLVFATTVHTLLPSSRLNWVIPRNTGLSERHFSYAQKTSTQYSESNVWLGLKDDPLPSIVQV